MPMTPWAFVGDMSQQLDVLRVMLTDDDPDTAELTDRYILSSIATFGYQQAGSMLAQVMISKIGQQVMRHQEVGGVTTEWGQDRLNGLRMVKNQADRGQLPDPAVGIVTRTAPGSMVMANQPGW